MLYMIIFSIFLYCGWKMGGWWGLMIMGLIAYFVMKGHC
jgi:hypothetical protein